MAKEKLSFKNGSKFCYSVKENNLKDFYDRIIELSTISEQDNYVVELRLDYLINKKIDVEEIIDCINKAKKVLSDRFDIERQYIATVRNFTNGGNCYIDDKTYFEIIEKLYSKPCVDAIDIDFDFYEKKATNVKKLFSGKKSLIITYTCRDKVLTNEEYDDIFKTLIKTPAYIVKIITKAFSFDDTEKLMETARKYDEILKDSKKVAVIISTGKIGIISRVWHEYTNTMLVYLETGDFDMIPYGDINEAIYNKYRKMLSTLDGFNNKDLLSAIADK